MRVIGAFVDKVVGELVADWMAGLGGIEFGGSGCNAHDVIALCVRNQPEAIIVGGEFFAHVDDVREAIVRRDLREPLWIALVGPPRIYSCDRAVDLGIHSEMTQADFTVNGFAAAVEVARHARYTAGAQVRIATAFPTTIPNSTLATLLRPWPEFRVLANCPTVSELVATIRSQPTHLVAFDPHFVSKVPSTREQLHHEALVEPQWLLLLSHTDPATLVGAAIAGIDHMFTADQLEPAGRFAAWIRDVASGGPPADGPLRRVRLGLTITKDDDDRRIIHQLVNGASNDEIARYVFLSVNTVKNRLSRMMQSAGVSNRTELALLFARATALGDDVP